MAFLTKPNTNLSQHPAIPFSGISLREMKTHVHKRGLYADVYSSVIHDSQNVE